MPATIMQLHLPIIKASIAKLRLDAGILLDNLEIITFFFEECKTNEIMKEAGTKQSQLIITYVLPIIMYSFIFKNYKSFVFPDKH